MRAVSRLALITLGSNDSSAWGDARETVQKAMTEVAQLSDHPTEISGLYATPAFPAGSGPDFVNAALAVVTKLSAPDLLAALHEIEGRAGRKRTVRWGQRTLDLDLIAMDDQVLPDAATQTNWHDLELHDQQQMVPTDLILPHPRMQERAFVLVPLSEVAPDWQHPLLNLTVTQMCGALPAADRADVVRLGP